MKNILVIDDSDIIRESIKLLLEENEYNVVLADNGQEGILLARKFLPDLIICDVNMPEVDGYQVLEALSKEEETVIIPFVFLTGQKEEIDIRRGMNLGADDYLTKPFNVNDLLLVIETRLKKHFTFKEKSEKKLNDLRNSISQLLPHEFRTPLSSILGFSEYLMQYYDKTMDEEEVIEISKTINTSAKRLNNLIENFILYSQLQIIKANPGYLSSLRQIDSDFTKPIIKDAARNKAISYHREDDIVLSIEDSTIAIKPEYLEKLVSEIVDNSLKFSTNGKKIYINSEIKEKKYILKIADEGRGIFEQQLKDIGGFMQFGRNIYEQQGTGLGLIIAKLIAEVFEIDLEISSEVNKGTLVTLSFKISL